MIKLMINVCIFEDSGYQSLYPLTFFRPIYELLIGMDSLLDKIHYYFDYANITLHCRDYLKPVLKRRQPDYMINQINRGAPCLFVNGRVVMTEDLFKTFTENTGQYDLLFTYRGHIVATYLRGKNLDYMKRALEKMLPNEELVRSLRPKCVAKELDDISMVTDLWDLINLNSEMISHDFLKKNNPGIIKGEIHPFTALYEENNIFIGKKSCLEDFVVLHAKNGPIYIEENVYIQSGTRLEGPIFIGKNSTILGGHIRSSSIGQHCKVAGEVSCSVINNYSNKAHDGFIGHSYINEWVNLGAGTTTSNLKNTYGNIKIESRKEKIQTEQQFLGAFIGDHVKTGIGTRLNAGTVIGFASNLFGSDIHPKYIPPFTWGGDNKYDVFELEKLYQVISKMMGRRDISLHEDEKSVLRYLYDAIRSVKVTVPPK